MVELWGETEIYAEQQGQSDELYFLGTTVESVPAITHPLNVESTRR